MPITTHSSIVLPLLLGGLLLGGCRTLQPPEPRRDVPAVIPVEDHNRVVTGLKAAPHQLAIFDEELASAPLDTGRSAIIVDLDRQRLLVYSKGRLVAASRIASGRAGFRSPTGEFVIGQKNPDHASNLYGNFVDTETGEVVGRDVDSRHDESPEGAEFVGAPMRWFMRFNRLDGTWTAVGLHAGHVPGRPASHGCIRMPSRAARALFTLAPSGTPVQVYGVRHGTPDRPLALAVDGDA